MTLRRSWTTASSAQTLELHQGARGAPQRCQALSVQAALTNTSSSHCVFHGMKSSFAPIFPIRGYKQLLRTNQKLKKAITILIELLPLHSCWILLSLSPAHLYGIVAPWIQDKCMNKPLTFKSMCTNSPKTQRKTGFTSAGERWSRGTFLPNA